MPANRQTYRKLIAIIRTPIRDDVKTEEE